MKSGFSFQFHYTSNINQERLVSAIARVMVIDQVAVAFFSLKKKIHKFQHCSKNSYKIAAMRSIAHY